MDRSSHDPGGKVRLPLQPGVRGLAEFSPCGRYRLWLSRFWDADANALPYVERGPQLVVDNSVKSGITPYALWIGMNPSTAEADVDDPTIRKEMHFTRAMGLSGYIKCNVMDYRATSPRDLVAPGVHPCSAENFSRIARMAECAQIIVAAWGILPKPQRRLATSIALMLNRRRLMCLGVTKDGSPKHPLYLRKDAQPIVYREPQEAAIGGAAE